MMVAACPINHPRGAALKEGRAGLKLSFPSVQFYL